MLKNFSFLIAEILSEYKTVDIDIDLTEELASTYCNWFNNLEESKVVILEKFSFEYSTDFFCKFLLFYSVLTCIKNSDLQVIYISSDIGIAKARKQITKLVDFFNKFYKQDFSSNHKKVRGLTRFNNNSTLTTFRVNSYQVRNEEGHFIIFDNCELKNSDKFLYDLHELTSKETCKKVIAFIKNLEKLEEMEGELTFHKEIKKIKLNEA